VDIADKELIAEFVIESQEGLANVERQMLALEAAGAAATAEQVNAVFRTMHSIKGAAGFLGLDRIGMLAHRLEEILNHMRNRDVVATPQLVTTMLHAADCMKCLMDSVYTSNDADISNHIDSLCKFLPGDAGSDTLTDSSAALEQLPAMPQVEPLGATPASASTPPALSDAVREFLIECYENLDQMDRDLLALEQDPSCTPLIRGIFRTVHTIKGGAGFLGLTALERLAHTAEGVLGKIRDGSLPLTHALSTVLLQAVDKFREGLQRLETTGNDIGFDPADCIAQLSAAQQESAVTSGVGPVLAVTKPPVAPTPPAPVLPPVATKQSAATIAQPTEERAAKFAGDLTVDAGCEKASIGDSTIRVDVALLDKLMTRVGELVLARNQILQHVSRLDDGDLISTTQRLNLITTELQEGVMKTRMQPIGNVWAKFPRVVRDLSSQLGKQVRIELAGKETELDKTIVEAIKDPLTHLIRNSIDHGIERPEVRIANGKHPEGRLQLSAYHEGGQVNIEICDDGAGLNVDRIRKKGIERGLVSAEQAARLSEREIFQLIFSAGFSTAEQVTSVSGRGVGMDVVKTNIERIGGTIDLQSRSGEGTTIRIKIPLTLAIIPALVITNDGDRYAIPQVSLLELVRLEAEDATKSIEYVHGTPVYRLRGKLLPLVRLSERLKMSVTAANRPSEAPLEPASDVVNIVVLRADESQFGLIVDKVNDTEEIVVKPLGRQLKSIGEYAGATIMGDGAVALILDVKGMAVAAGVHANSAETTLAASGDANGNKDVSSQSLLLVDVGDARRFALPTSMVARLERIPAKIIEQADGREVIQYRGKILPLVHLVDLVDHSSRRDLTKEELQIVVYEDAQHRFGLVVNRIVDVAETVLNLAQSQVGNEHLLGTAIIQQRVTDVLNLSSVARSQCPARVHA
jgi:two-component system chemotaxis sensor kinase CheA